MRTIFKPPENLERHYRFDELEESTETDGIFVAALWSAWYKQGNERGDEVRNVYVDNQPLGYWLGKLEERIKQNG